MLPLIKTAALVVILFLIMALLSRMSAPELTLDVSVQHGVKKLVQKSQEAAAQLNTSTHPVHHLVHASTALNNLDAAFLLVNPKHCETLTGCSVNELYNNMVQKQEAAANILYMQQQAPMPQPVHVHRR